MKILGSRRNSRCDARFATAIARSLRSTIRCYRAVENCGQLLGDIKVHAISLLSSWDNNDICARDGRRVCLFQSLSAYRCLERSHYTDVSKYADTGASVIVGTLFVALPATRRAIVMCACSGRARTRRGKAARSRENSEKCGILKGPRGIDKVNALTRRIMKEKTRTDIYESMMVTIIEFAMWVARDKII